MNNLKIVGIVAQDWANAAYNVFQSLKRYGMSASLITLYKHKGGFSGKYDIGYWNQRSRGNDLIRSADLYIIFESGGTIPFLKSLPLQNRPRVLVVNSSSFYHKPSKFDAIRPFGDIMVGLTANYPVDDIILCNQPVDENKFKVRTNYNQIGTRGLCAGAAPYMNSHKTKKGLLTIEHKMPLHYIMGETHDTALKRMLDECDIFTHGIYFAYGYTLVEAAMMAIPCFGSILDRDKKYLLLDGEYPVYDIGREGEKISEMLDFFSHQENREMVGKKLRQWALKYHSQKACFEMWTEIFQKVL